MFCKCCFMYVIKVKIKYWLKIESFLKLTRKTSGKYFNQFKICQDHRSNHSQMFLKMCAPEKQETSLGNTCGQDRSLVRLRAVSQQLFLKLISFTGIFPVFFFISFDILKFQEQLFSRNNSQFGYIQSCKTSKTFTKPILKKWDFKNSLFIFVTTSENCVGNKKQALAKKSK